MGRPAWCRRHEVEHDLVELGAVVAAITLADVDDALGRLGVLTVVAAIDVKARRVEVDHATGEAEHAGRVGGEIAEELGDAGLVERVEGAAERVVVEVLRQDAGPEEALGGLGFKEAGDEVEPLINEAQAVEDHGFDGQSRRDVSLLVVLRDAGVDALGDLKLIAHGGDEAEVVEDGAGVGVRHGARSPGGGVRANLLNQSSTTEREGCGRWVLGSSLFSRFRKSSRITVGVKT